MTKKEETVVFLLQETNLSQFEFYTLLSTCSNKELLRHHIIGCISSHIENESCVDIIYNVLIEKGLIDLFWDVLTKSTSKPFIILHYNQLSQLIPIEYHEWFFIDFYYGLTQRDFDDILYSHHNFKLIRGQSISNYASSNVVWKALKLDPNVYHNCFFEYLVSREYLNLPTSPSLSIQINEQMMSLQYLRWYVFHPELSLMFNNSGYLSRLNNFKEWIGLLAPYLLVDINLYIYENDHIKTINLKQLHPKHLEEDLCIAVVDSAKLLIQQKNTNDLLTKTCLSKI